jgi:integrase
MGVKIREKIPGSGAWWVFVNHKGERGSMQIGSEKAARRTAEKIQAEIGLGLFVFPTQKAEPQITLEHYYRKFERTYLKTACRESTAERYDECFRIHILPRFGGLPLPEVTRDKVKEFVADLVEKRLARATVRIITASLCTVFSHAIEDQIVTANPAVKLTRFYKQAHVLHEKIEPLAEHEVPLFLEAAKNRDAKRRRGNPEYYPLFLCAIHTGLRAGELAGLQWGDIDWNGKFMMVRRSIGKNGQVYPTKTNKVRRGDMSDDLLAEFGAFRRRRLAEALQTGSNEISEWIFGSSNGSPLDMHNVERREFEKCLQAAKLRKIRFHDLRHTIASILLQQGASLAYIKDLLGHSSIKVTVDIYGHLVPGANREVVNRLPSLTTKTEQAKREAR